MNIKQNQVVDFFNQPIFYLRKNYGISIRKELVSKVINLDSFNEILDVGCGDGSISLSFLRSEIKLTLIDVSEEMIKIARTKTPLHLEKNVNLFCTSLNDYSSQIKFDIIFAIGLLAHVPSVHEALIKLKSMLSKNGKLIIQYSDYTHLITRFHFLTRDKNLYSLNKIKKNEFDALCESLGLSVEQVIKFSNILPGMGMLPNNILYSFIKFCNNSNLAKYYRSEYLYVLKLK
jgi:trans-aconitate methyltransferase